MSVITEKIEVPKLLSIKEVAKILGCSERTVLRLKEKGELKFSKLGGLQRMRADQINSIFSLLGDENLNEKGGTE